MNNIYLTPPAIVSALGEGREKTWRRLLAATNTLRLENRWMADAEREVMRCRYPGVLASLPKTTPAYLRSRNNQLPETTLRHIDHASARPWEVMARIGSRWYWGRRRVAATKMNRPSAVFGARALA